MKKYKVKQDISVNDEKFNSKGVIEKGTVVISDGCIFEDDNLRCIIKEGRLINNGIYLFMNDLEDISILKNNIDPYDVVYFLNKCRENHWDTLFDMYRNGSFLSMDVDKEKAKAELNKLLAIPINEYKQKNNEMYAHNGSNNDVGLNLLVEEIGILYHFEIKYDGYKNFGEEFYAQDYN